MLLSQQCCHCLRSFHNHVIPKKRLGQRGILDSDAFSLFRVVALRGLVTESNMICHAAAPWCCHADDVIPQLAGTMQWSRFSKGKTKAAVDSRIRYVWKFRRLWTRRPPAHGKLHIDSGRFKIIQCSTIFLDRIPHLQKNRTILTLEWKPLLEKALLRYGYLVGLSSYKKSPMLYLSHETKFCSASFRVFPSWGSGECVWARTHAKQGRDMVSSEGKCELVWLSQEGARASV